jgi:hypothetical protein
MKKTVLIALIVVMAYSSWAQNDYPIEKNTSIKLDGGYINLVMPETSGGWARGLFYRESDWTHLGGFGMYGSASFPVHLYIAHGESPWTSGLGLYVKTNGDVGIGTYTPSEALSIYRENSDANLKLTTNLSSGTSNMLFRINPTGRDAAIVYQNDGRLSFKLDASNAAGMSSNEYLTIKPNGNIGIDNPDPSSKLDVNGNVSTGRITISEYSPQLILQRNTDEGGFIQGIQTKMLDGTNNWYFGAYQADGWRISKGDYNDDVVFSINSSGNAIIDGKLTTKEVEVKVNTGADFVFEETYPIPSLEEVEAFVKQNKHLPEIAPAAEMEANGIKLGEMNIKLLQKIEELTLYLIEQDKKIKEESLKTKEQSEKIKELKSEAGSWKLEANELKAQNESFAKLLKAQQTAIEELKKEINELKTSH